VEGIYTTTANPNKRTVCENVFIETTAHSSHGRIRDCGSLVLSGIDRMRRQVAANDDNRWPGAREYI